MKKKSKGGCNSMRRALEVLVFLVSLLAADYLFAATPLTQLGRASLMGPIEDEQELYEKVCEFRPDLVKVVKMMDPSLDASEAVRLTEVEIKNGRAIKTDCPKGTIIEVMGFRGKAGLQILRDRVWQGNKPMSGWIVCIRIGAREVKLFFPGDCGNISVVRMP
ncbi:MAG: hypothetical protein PHQ47_02300, partial [Candidatus Portnoybacteria bacterium]|nr:hypothetical protein [Candidatus Portnoybacteria bacterium]